jgi:hypothetical protein
MLPPRNRAGIALIARRPGAARARASKAGDRFDAARRREGAVAMSRSTISAVVQEEIAAKTSNAVESSSRRGRIFAHSQKFHPPVGTLLSINFNIPTCVELDYAAKT